MSQNNLLSCLYLMKTIKEDLFLNSFVLLLSCATIPAYAVNTLESATGIVSSRFVGITFLNANLSIDAQGCTTSSGFVRPSSSSYTSYLTVSLQKNTSSGWITIKSWSGSGTGLSGVNLSGSYYVGSGTYRSCATASVYNSSGSLVDNETAYSSVKNY